MASIASAAQHDNASTRAPIGSAARVAGRIAQFLLGVALGVYHRACSVLPSAPAGTHR